MRGKVNSGEVLLKAVMFVQPGTEVEEADRLGPVRRVAAEFDPRATRDGMSVIPMGHRTHLKAKCRRGKQHVLERLDTAKPLGCRPAEARMAW